MKIKKVFSRLFQKAIHSEANFKFPMLAIILSLTMNNSFAQLSIVNSEVRMEEIATNQVNGICAITVSDTTNCSSIAIEISDALNNTIGLNNEFIFDKVTGLPNGMTYFRSGNEIEIGLGIFQSASIWKARIRLKNTANVWTTWQEFIFN